MTDLEMIFALAVFVLFLFIGLSWHYSRKSKGTTTRKGR